MRNSNGRYRWSIIFTRSSSSQTVFTSRGTPSRLTRTRLLLRTAEGGEETRRTGTPKLPLHLPREGVVVRDLLLDLQQLIGQAASFVVHGVEGVQDAPLALAPPPDLPFRRLKVSRHRHRPGAIGGKTGMVWLPSLWSSRVRPNSMILFRTASNSCRSTARRRSSCRIRSRIRFRRSRHFFCSSKARSTLDGAILATHSRWSRLFNRDVPAFIPP